MKNIVEKYIEYKSFKGYVKIADVKFNDEYNTELQHLINDFPKSYAKMIKSKAIHKNKAKVRTYLYNYIIESTPLLSDSFYTLKTKIYWVLNKMTTFPWCMNDDEKMHQMTEVNVKNVKTGYPQFCNTECQHKSSAYFDSIKKSIKQKYGDNITNAFQIEHVKEDLKNRKDEIELKKSDTRKKHFGDDKGWNLKKSLETRKLKYGNAWNVKQIKNTKLLKYNDENWNNPTKNSETKRKNGTFNTSNPEKTVHDILCKHLNKDNVKSQYKSEEYPFLCDFYLEDFDLYIECNFSWTHGGHFFDNNNENDILTLKKWKDKNTEYYDNAIETWTKRDILKRDTAIQNKLNYLVFWNVDEAISTLDNVNFYLTLQAKLKNNE